jgi:hypothetical protein
VAGYHLCAHGFDGVDEVLRNIERLAVDLEFYTYSVRSSFAFCLFDLL